MHVSGPGEPAAPAAGSGPCAGSGGAAAPERPRRARVTRGVTEHDQPVDAGLPPAPRGRSSTGQPRESTGMQTGFWANASLVELKLQYFSGNTSS